MVRLGVLTVILALAACGPAAGYAPVPFPRPPAVAGRWVVTFPNGVVERCEVRKGGSAYVAEPLRNSGGVAEVKGAAVVITFHDDRVERWTKSGRDMIVEHWFPAAAYPAGPKVVGVARRAP